MKAIIEIDMDNAAFEEHNGEELAGVLRRLADYVSYFPVIAIRCVNVYGHPVDSDGNTVGTFRVEGDE